MKLRIHKYSSGEIIFFALFYLLVFQNPLTAYASGAFAYIDEMFALLGILLPAAILLGKGKMRFRRDTVQTAAWLLAFVCFGLLGNILFRYQPLKPVLKDLYVNLKFFLSVSAGFYLIRAARPDRERLLAHTKFCITVLFALLLADVVFDLFPGGGYRYGMRVRSLIFGHVTYLAGTCVFLLSVLLFHFEKRNAVYMALALLVLMSTLRGKALAGAAVYVFLIYIVIIRRRRLKLWHLAAIGAVSLWVAWEQINFYYIELAGKSARSVLTQTALRIMEDYFPIGTGFGTYGSAVAGEYYSPVYVRYGFLHYYELNQGSAYLSDTFWPIILGQTGFAGTVCYLAVLARLFRKLAPLRGISAGAYAAVLFVCIYLLISSTSEPTFCNSVSIPLAMLLGYGLTVAEKGGARPDEDL